MSALRLSARLCEALLGAEEEMVEVLLRRGADPNLVLPEGIAAIHLASGMEQESGIRCLGLMLQYGGDPNVRSADDLTPLHVAASWGCCTCLRLLLMDGGDPRLEDQDGNTALDLAWEQGHEVCVHILRASLKENGEERSLWTPCRRAESFLTSLSEDFLETVSSLPGDDPCLGPVGAASEPFPSKIPQRLETGSSSRHLLAPALKSCPNNGMAGVFPGEGRLFGEPPSRSFLTECSRESTVSSDGCSLRARALTSFASRSSPARRGFSGDEPSPPAAEVGVGATPPGCCQSTTVHGCRSSPASDGSRLCASARDSRLRHSSGSCDLPNAAGSRGSPGTPLPCAVWGGCQADGLLARRDADATLDLSCYRSFLGPGFVRAADQEGLDATSPDHAYLFCQGDSATVSDWERTVVDPALLWRARRDRAGSASEEKSFGGSSEGGSGSRYASCASECYTSASEASRSCCGPAKCEASGGRPGSMESRGWMSPTPPDPCSGTLKGCPEECAEVISVAGAASRPASAPEGTRRSCDGLACREACTGKGPLARAEGRLGDTEQLVLPPAAQATPLANAPLPSRKEWGLSPLPPWEAQRLQHPNGHGAGIVAFPEAPSPAVGEEATTDRGREEAEGTLSAAAREESRPTRGSVEGSALSLHPQDAGSSATQGTVLLERPSEETQPRVGSETPGTLEAPPPVLRAREEEATDLAVRLRMMMLATKACHSPLLQPAARPCHVTPRTKSRATTSSAQESGSSSLFDEALEMPQRPRRMRSPEGAISASSKERNRDVGLRTSSPPSTEGEAMSSLDETQSIAAGPGGCSPSNRAGSCPLGPAGASPSVLTGPGGGVCTGKDGAACSLLLEGTLSAREARQLPQEEGSDRTGLDPAPSGAEPVRPGARRSRAKRLAHPGRVSFSRLSAGGGPPDPRGGRLSPVKQGVPLSPGGRPVNLSTTEPVEYLYVDAEEGHVLVERHVPGTDDSALSATSSEDTVIYDWRALVSPAAGRSSRGSSPPRPPSGVRGLSDEALVRKLRDYGVSPGPVTGLTRNLYVKLLEKVMSDPKSKARRGSAGYSPELCSALETYQIPDSKGDEMALAEQFDQPDKSTKWREGLLKSSFNYLLLDPRVTQNLPFRCQYVSRAECFRTFISAIFYVGKGKRSRPYCHLYEALTHYKRGGRKKGGQVCSKVQHILEIWASGQGVISMHCFQNVIPVEAYTREACMVDAVGLKMLTNQKKGNYYGVVAAWPIRRRRCLGVYLLHRAMQIFLAEGERQLRPTDIHTGQ